MRWSARTLTMTRRCLSMLEGTAWTPDTMSKSMNSTSELWISTNLLPELYWTRRLSGTWMLSGSGSDFMDSCASSRSERALSHRSVRLSRLWVETEKLIIYLFIHLFICHLLPYPCSYLSLYNPSAYSSLSSQLTTLNRSQSEWQWLNSPSISLGSCCLSIYCWRTAVPLTVWLWRDHTDRTEKDLKKKQLRFWHSEF